MFNCLGNIYFSYVRTEKFESLISLYFWSFTRKDAEEVSYYYNEEFVTQHDLLRELAIQLSSQKPIIERTRLIVDIRENNLPDWWMKPQVINARLLSISTGWYIFLSNKGAHTHNVTY